jgi:class 3 adenylate cyclase
MQGEVSAHIIARKKFLTVFFSDLIGFTALSDLLPSNILTTILNIYLDTMTNIALKHGGTIDKYMGDMIMIFFGDSENSSPAEDAKRCALMAIEMREKLHESNLKWVEFGIDEPLKMRIGIHSGICSIGNFGSNFRMNYTIIGSTVNLASRLEHIAKANEILISEETYELLKKHFTCDKQDAVHVKGIKGSITPYQLIGRYPSSSNF